MGSIDDITWFALTLTLSLVGLLATALLWRSRGAASGLRALAWTLVPGAAYLTGTLQLLGRIGEEIGAWAVHLVLSPAVWLGVALAGVAVVLFAVASGMRSRGVGVRGARGGEAGGSSGKRQVSASGGPKAAQPADDDMADIEAILRKHGIS